MKMAPACTPMVTQQSAQVGFESTPYLQSEARASSRRIGPELLTVYTVVSTVDPPASHTAKLVPGCGRTQEI